MSGNKFSQFIKRRYLVSPSAEVYVELEESEKDLEAEEELTSEAAPALEPEAELMTDGVDKVDEVEELDKAFLAYEKSNHGRSYGWWVCIDGKRVATLEYRCLLEDRVYLYGVTVIDDQFLTIDLNPEKWDSPNVTLQSRYAASYMKQGLNMAAVGQEMIVVDDLVLPEDHFRRQHQELQEFHDRLLEKAKSKSTSS